MDRIARLKEFLAESPDDSFLKHALALEYIKMGNDEAARGLFEQILAHDAAYVGSYYHLAKLLERNEATEAAIAVYEQGMQQALQAKDQHAYNELRAAYEDLTF